MFPARRRHPLQTFRFWFLVLGTVSVTLAWRLDMLPVRFGPPETGRRTEESFTEVVLPRSADWEEPVRQSEKRPAPSSETASFAAAGTRPIQPDSVIDPPPVQADEDADRQLLPEQSQPFARSSERRHPALSNSPPVQDAGSDVLQTAATTDPFAASGSTAVQHADQSPPAPSIDFTEIDRLTQSNSPIDHIEAHRELSSLYWQQPQSRGELRERIDALAQRIYFQPQPHYMPAYEIAAGDMLQTIGKKYDLNWQYLAKLNRVDPQRIRGGQRLKVIKGPFSAVIDLSDYELTIHAHGYYVTRYPVGIGKDGSTPIGAFTVQNKQVDPTYYGPDGVIEHDDPANPLGECWIDIGNSYGIHGTIDPGSIGRSESRGCIRMHNDDVAAVFDLLIMGSEVTIRE
ncbi:MAG: L,D-transpeptidase family protein [Planctomycetaceae bacterium]